MPRLIGLDIGTSSCKAIVIDEHGSILASHQEAYPIRSPGPGWHEQNPEDWWEAARKCLDSLRDFSADAIGLTGQMHGAVLLDSNGDPIRPALLWNDMRTVEEVRAIEDAVGAESYRAITCNRSDPGLQAPKLLWVRNNEPDNWGKVAKVLLPKDFIAYRLTGELATDFGDASGTGLFDTANLKFSDEILGALNISKSLMPVPLPSTEAVGHDRDGRVVVIGSGDQAANGVGVGAISPGVMSIALGSSGVLFTASTSCGFHPSGTLNCFAHATGKWLLMGVTLNCGTLIEWGRREIFGGLAPSEISKLAGNSTKEVHFVPFVGGERCPVSITSPAYGFSQAEASPEDKAAAILRAITFNLRAMLPMIASIAGKPKAIRVSGGGASSGFWRQAIADAFQVPVERLATDEGPSMGAALLAGVSIGIWDSVADAASRTVKTVVTEVPREEVSDLYEAWRKHVEMALGRVVAPYE